MRSLHLVKTSIGATWALRQINELLRLGVEVHIAMPKGPMVEKYNEVGAVVHELEPIFSPFRLKSTLTSMRNLSTIVKRIKPDVIHSHFVITTLLMRFALRGHSVPRIFQVPGPLHLEHWFFRCLEMYSSDNRDYWLASCLWTKGAYQRMGVKLERIGLSYYGVNEPDFKDNNDTGFDIRKSLGLPEKSILLIMVAFFYPPKKYLMQKVGLKGHEDLIDAMGILAQKNPDLHCVFVGGQWGEGQQYFKDVKQYALQKAPNNCHFLGTRSDVPCLYRQCQMAVHPSHSENVGGAVESMYADVLTLTTNVGGFPDLVIDGETGFLTEPKAPEKLAEKIESVLANKERNQEIVERAKIKVREVMDVEKNAREVLNFYNHVVNMED